MDQRLTLIKWSLIKMITDQNGINVRIYIIESATFNPEITVA